VRVRGKKSKACAVKPRKRKESRKHFLSARLKPCPDARQRITDRIAEQFFNQIGGFEKSSEIVHGRASTLRSDAIGSQGELRCSAIRKTSHSAEKRPSCVRVNRMGHPSRRFEICSKTQGRALANWAVAGLCWTFGAKTPLGNALPASG
jgi:hypothetical protein